MSTQAKLQSRSEVKTEDTWDLSKLFDSDEAWEKGLSELEASLPKLEALKGRLATSYEGFRDALLTYFGVRELEERVAYYAMLRYSEDAGDSENQMRYAKYSSIGTRIETATSFLAPELHAMDPEVVRSHAARDELADYRIYLERVLRYRDHVLSEPEERILSQQQEVNETAQKAFGALNDVDLEFGSVTTPDGERALTHATFSSLMHHENRELRKTAYTQFMEQYDKHRNTIAALFAGSVKLDVYQAKVRKHPSARAAALFAGNIPESVYDNLVDGVGSGLAALHDYYRLRAKMLGVEKLTMYDKYAPVVADVKLKHSYDEAVDLLVDALAPLGSEYVDVISGGLRGRWVDRYENKGKRSGAFSAGSFFGDPHILMNYQEDSIRDVFTLAHEGGHSMHSYFSATSNPFPHYDYTIFEAETASTFNEKLLFDYLMANTSDSSVKASLVNSRIDDLVATFFRQTMFAEYEHLVHVAAEKNEPLTVDSMRSVYAGLLEKYFGDAAEIHEIDDLECLRIPHFYRAFYVYQYATGISASIALANRVVQGGDAERDDYLGFLRSGGSRFPIDSLKAAGVDMDTPVPVEGTVTEFKRLVAELEKLVG